MTNLRSGQFVPETLSNGMENIRNMRNMAFYDGYWWWQEMSGEGAAKSYLNTYYSEDFVTTHAASDSYTGDGLNPTTSTNLNQMCRLYGTTLFSAGSYKKDMLFVCFLRYSTDAGVSWNTYTNVVVGLTLSYEIPVLLDVFVRGSYTYLLWTWTYSTGVFHLDATTSAGGGGTGSHLVIYAMDTVYPGVTIRGNYYFVVKLASGQWDIRYWNGSTFTNQVEILSGASAFTEPTLYDSDFMQFWEQDGIQLLIDPYYLRFRTCDDTDGTGTSAWIETPAVSAPSTANAIIWNSDYTRIKYIIWDNYIWAWLMGGALVKVMSYGGDAYVGHIDFFNNGSSLAYQFTIADFVAQACRLKSAIYDPVTVQLKTMIAPVTNQYFFLYDSNDELIAEGWVRQYSLDQQQYTWRLESGVRMDFRRKITKSYVAQTAKEILTYDIQSCDYLYSEGTDLSDPVGDFTYSVKNKTILDRLKWADARFGYVTTIAPDNKVTWGPFTNSGITLSRTTGSISSVSPLQKRVETFSILTLYGKGIEVTVRGDMSSSNIFDWYEEIDDIDELTDLAEQIISDKNIVVQSLDVVVANKGYILPGTYVTLILPEYGITSSSWYVIASAYNPLTDQCAIQLTDSYVAPKLKRDTQNLEQKATTNSADITANDARITTIESDKLTDPLTTQGDIIIRNATVTTRLPIGTDGYVLTSNGATANPSWQAPPSTPEVYLPLHAFNVIGVGGSTSWITNATSNSRYIECRVGDGAISLWFYPTYLPVDATKKLVLTVDWESTAEATNGTLYLQSQTNDAAAWATVATYAHTFPASSGNYDWDVTLPTSMVSGVSYRLYMYFAYNYGTGNVLNVYSMSLQDV